MAARGGERRIAVARRHIQHRLTGALVHRLAQAFAGDLRGRADDGMGAEGPGCSGSAPTITRDVTVDDRRQIILPPSRSSGCSGGLSSWHSRRP
jgi:hypothetical protein